MASKTLSVSMNKSPESTTEKYCQPSERRRSSRRGFRLEVGTWSTDLSLQTSLRFHSSTGTFDRPLVAVSASLSSWNNEYNFLFGYDWASVYVPESRLWNPRLETGQISRHVPSAHLQRTGMFSIQYVFFQAVFRTLGGETTILASYFELGWSY